MDLKRIIHYSRLGAPVGVMRFSGLYIIRPESVPDHAACCTTLAIMMHKDLRAVGIIFDLKDLIYRIAIHDIPEAITSDVVRPLKYHHEALTKEFRLAERDMVTRFGYPDYILEDCENAKDETCIEGFLMIVIDALQVLTKLYEEYYVLHNDMVKPEYDKVMLLYQKVIAKSKDLYGEVLYEYLNSIYISFFNA